METLKAVQLTNKQDYYQKDRQKRADMVKSQMQELNSPDEGFKAKYFE